MIRRCVDGLVQVFLWPASVAHELTHLVAAYPWTRRVKAYEVRPFRPNWIELDIQDGAPGWAISIAAVAPSLVGVAFAASVLVLLAVGGGRFPKPADTPGRWLLIAAWWFVYTSPSTDDIAALRSGSGGDNP